VTTLDDLLPPDRAARLERLALRSRRPIAGALAGQHGSPRRGSSLDFADHRAYTPGDDYRKIDQNLLARLDQLVIKLFDADDDLTLNVLFDDSGSMALHGKDSMAKQLVAALGFVSLKRRDAVVLHTLHQAPVRCAGASGLPTLLQALQRCEPSGPTDLVAAASRFMGAKGPGLMLIVSDFLSPDWHDALRSLPTRRHDQAVAVHVVHPDEITPSLSGDLALVDTETGALMEVSLGPSSMPAVHAHIAHWLETVRSSCARIGFDYSRLLATDNLDTHLSYQWRRMDLLR
jgi:uncharacterized protein (DUF58 family)